MPCDKSDKPPYDAPCVYTLYHHTTPGHTMMAVRARRKALGVLPAYKRVDTCAAEFEVREE